MRQAKRARLEWALGALLAVVLFTASLATAQSPGTTVFTNVGSLFCGVRLFTATTVQTYCYTGKTPNDANLKLIHNTITTLVPGTATAWPNYIVIAAAYPEASGALDAVTWMVKPDGTYQIVASVCQMPPPTQGAPTTGACSTTPSSSPMVTGTLAKPAQ